MIDRWGRDGWPEEGADPAALVADEAAALNPGVAGGAHAAVHREYQVIRWFTDLLD